MRQFLAGVVVGALIVALVWQLGGSTPSEDAGRHAAIEAPPSDATPTDEPGALLRGSPVPEVDEAPKHPAHEPLDAAKGIVLRIGDGLDLGTGRVVRGEAAREADLFVQEIWRGSGAVCGTRHGSARIALPTTLSRAQIELDAADTFRERATVAPDKLESLEASFAISTRDVLRRLAFVQDESGAAYRVELVHATKEPLATERRLQVRITKAGRGDAQAALGLPTLRKIGPPASDTHARTLKILEAHKRDIGFFTFTLSNLRRVAYVADELPGGLSVGGTQGVVFEKPLDRRVNTSAHNAIHAMSGVAAKAEVQLNHHSVLRVVGDLDGAVVVDDHATLIIEGDLVGRVRCKNHAKVILHGDLRGDLVIGPYARVFLLGELRRLPTFLRSSNNVLWIDQVLGEEDIRRIVPTPPAHSKLHLPESPIGAGVHTDVAGFATVEVGGERWKSLQGR